MFGCPKSDPEDWGHFEQGSTVNISESNNQQELSIHVLLMVQIYLSPNETLIVLI